MSNKNYQGGCHCGAVSFNFNLNRTIQETQILRCNCSMCEKIGFLHIIIPKQQFQLTSKWEQLNCYQFNTKIAKHYFCQTCGIKSFYQPRSHPNCWSVNARCVDNISKYELAIEDFNGKQWSKNISNIL